MELKHIGKNMYRSGGKAIRPGRTTEGMNLSDEKKEQMLKDFPAMFEVIEVAAETKVVAGTETENKVVDLAAETVKADAETEESAAEEVKPKRTRKSTKKAVTEASE